MLLKNDEKHSRHPEEIFPIQTLSKVFLLNFANTHDENILNILHVVQNTFSVVVDDVFYGKILKVSSRMQSEGFFMRNVLKNVERTYTVKAETCDLLRKTLLDSLQSFAAFLAIC